MSLYAGLHFLNRLCKFYGHPIGNTHAFPLPEDLCKAIPTDLRKFGYSMSKARNIIGLAKLITDKKLDLEAMDNLSDESLVERLCEIPGVGRWTAQYAALRGYGRLNVFPGDDIGAQKKFQNWLGLRKKPDYKAIYNILDKWKPYRGMIYFYLLLDYQAQQGLHTARGKQSQN